MRYLRHTIVSRSESGFVLPVAIWRFPEPVCGIASGPLGGGIGERMWVMNATVPSTYARLDPDVHLQELAAQLALPGPGVGMLTAVDVRELVTASDGGVEAAVTVGLGHPTWAAAPDGDLRRAGGSAATGADAPADAGAASDGAASVAGTINIVVWVPVQLSPAALVNAAMTATEAKVQALWEYGADATGTATDALFIGCPTGGEPAEPYAGPRSRWGARLGRAVHRAVLVGARHWARRSIQGPDFQSDGPAPKPAASDSLGTIPGTHGSRLAAGHPVCDGPVSS